MTYYRHFREFILPEADGSDLRAFYVYRNLCMKAVDKKFTQYNDKSETTSFIGRGYFVTEQAENQNHLT